MHRQRPSGAQCFLDGCYYKFSNRKLWRYNDEEQDWVISLRPQGAVIAAIKKRDPFSAENWSYISKTMELGDFIRHRVVSRSYRVRNNHFN